MTTQLMERQSVSTEALPSPWVDRLFQRFATHYGKPWLDMWADIPLADVKDAWATELAGVTSEQIGAALKHLGKFPPTLPEFVALCKPPAARPEHRLLLPSPQVEQAKLSPALEREIHKRM